jgi:hypothetical protein
MTNHFSPRGSAPDPKNGVPAKMALFSARRSLNLLLAPKNGVPAAMALFCSRRSFEVC